MVASYINKVTDSLWPNGGPLTFKEPRKPEEKVQTKEEANRKLSTWLPGKKARLLRFYQSPLTLK